MKSPLAGRRFLITRPAVRATPWCEAFRDIGAVPVLRPLLRSEPLDPPNLANEVDASSWVAFTSAEAVRRFREAYGGALRRDVACVGSRTAAAAEEAGYAVRLKPEDESAQGLASALAAESPRGAAVLFPCAEGASDTFEQGLAAVGVEVRRVHLYRTAREDVDGDELANLLTSDALDAFLFASPSAVDAWFDALPATVHPLARRGPNAALGHATTEALRKWGGSADIVPERPHIRSLIGALESYFGA